ERLLELASGATETPTDIRFFGNRALGARAPAVLHERDCFAWIGCPPPSPGGLASFRNLSGSFAFAAVHEDELLLGRGRFGGHPLYYAQDCEGRTLACSGLDPLVKVLGRRSDFDETGIIELLLDIPGGPATPYRGIRRLGSAELLFVGPRGSRIETLAPARP